MFASYQAIVDVIAAEPKLQGKPKLVVFDCCQIIRLTAMVKVGGSTAHALWGSLDGGPSHD